MSNNAYTLEIRRPDGWLIWRGYFNEDELEFYEGIAGPSSLKFSIPAAALWWPPELRVLRQAWSRETSADPEGWTPENPAWGQCDVTALAVQDRLGGDLYCIEMGEQGHWFNRLPDKQYLDLTAEQFYGAGETTAGKMPTTSDREYVLSFPETAERYELLTERIRWPETN